MSQAIDERFEKFGCLFMIGLMCLVPLGWFVIATQPSEEERIEKFWKTDGPRAIEQARRMEEDALRQYQRATTPQEVEAARIGLELTRGVREEYEKRRLRDAERLEELRRRRHPSH